MNTSRSTPPETGEPVLPPGKVAVPEDVLPYMRDFRWPQPKGGYAWKRAGQEDAEAVNALFNKVFGQQRTIEDYLWKAWRSPGGPPVSVFAYEEDSGRVVSTMTGVRRRVWVDGREVAGVLLCETCTDPEARGGGRLYKGVVTGYGICAQDQEGAAFAFGGQSTDEAITVGSRWFGYVNIFTLTPLELRLSSGPGLRRRLGALGALLAPALDALLVSRWRRRDHGYQLRESESFGPEFDRMWEAHRDRYRTVVYRDAKALQWRYADCPAWRHRTLVAWRGDQPCGYLVWREWQVDGLRVATGLDVWDGADEDLAEALFDGARRASRTSGCAFLRFAAKPGSVEERALQRLEGFRVSSYEKPDRVLCGPNSGADYGFLPQQSIDVLRTVLDADSWFYTQGDCDYRD